MVTICVEVVDVNCLATLMRVDTIVWLFWNRHVLQNPRRQHEPQRTICLAKANQETFIPLELRDKPGFAWDGCRFAATQLFKSITCIPSYTTMLHVLYCLIFTTRCNVIMITICDGDLFRMKEEPRDVKIARECHS